VLLSAVLACLLAALATVAWARPADAVRPKCFGAAAHDPRRPCPNETRSVYPAEGSPAARPFTTSCRLLHEQPAPVCTFGAPAARATRHIALIGDSHALQWRPALEIVARSARWRGYSLTTAACAFSAATGSMPAVYREACDPWYRAARQWFRRHPEVSTVFVSQFTQTPIVPHPGQTLAAAKIAGFRRTWTTLPKTVKHVVVIHDTPITTESAIDCVRATVAAGTQQPGPVCATPRAVAMQWDAAVSAATSLRSPRYGSVDLTDFFCDARSCYPVIGGVRVYNDHDHITAAYARTLAPYLLRRLRTLVARW
jgi:hypothetical protein